jgi:hypothetical protein
MSHKLSCGEHVTLASNDAVRITRCPCGTVHLTITESGVTVQIDDDTLRGVWAGAECALEALEEAPLIGEAVN